MRDIILALFIFSCLPFAFKRPHVGILLWVWISVMNPHRLCYGFAYSFPWAFLIAGVTFLSMLMSKEPKSMPGGAPVRLMIGFALWTCVTTAAAFLPGPSLDMLDKVMKILLMTVVTMMVVRDKEQLHQLIYVLAASVGFFGVKGGIFTIRSGGTERVWGPPGSFIEGNNEVALAFIVTIPMMFYIMLNMKNKWIRYGVIGAMVLSLLAALGSYSRGALVGLSAMALVLWWRSPRKMLAAVVLAVVLPISVNFMPDKWFDRMDTIQTYEEDSSAMGRINAWIMAYNLALEHPMTGGGFIIYDAARFAKYAPDPLDIHAAHSIYFQVLGEHGFFGLGLYLALALTSWLRARWIIKACRQRADLKWAATLASMTQVSLIGFGVGGAFLSLAYFDVPYYLMAIIVITGRIVEAELKKPPPEPVPEPVPVKKTGRQPTLSPNH